MDKVAGLLHNVNLYDRSVGKINLMVTMNEELDQARTTGWLAGWVGWP